MYDLKIASHEFFNYTKFIHQDYGNVWNRDFDSSLVLTNSHLHRTYDLELSILYKELIES